MSQNFLLNALVSFLPSTIIYSYTYVSHLVTYLIQVRVHRIPLKSQPQWKVSHQESLIPIYTKLVPNHSFVVEQGVLFIIY